jgi:flagellar hook assembly protein FlgD
MTTAFHNQYRLPRADLQAVLDGMLKNSGGARGPHGFAHETNRPFDATAKAFGGAAFARYNQWIGQDVRHDLLKVAGELVQLQKPDGAFDLPYQSLPVMPSRAQAAFQAAQTWRQAYAITADDQWLPPMRRAEEFLHKFAVAATQATNLQDMNYSLLGLTAAGAGSVEGTVRGLTKQVLAMQHQDGGWGLNPGEQSGAFATGQTLYVLRQVGFNDQDAPIERGTAWLIAHQNQDGGWSHAGFDKAEAMWGVLGLVSIDVLSIAAAGIEDGQNVAEHDAQSPPVAIKILASDNRGTAVKQIELAVDDNAVARACGGELAWKWDVHALETGKHVVDVAAVNAKGEVSRRRFEVYAGPVFMTQIGSRSASDQTVLSLRDIATRPGTVEVEILPVDGNGVARGAAPVKKISRPSSSGPMSFEWDGRGDDGKSQKDGKYVARLRFRDGARVLQSADVPFVRATPEYQRREYGEVAGTLQLPAAAAAPAAAPVPSANTEVQLVDGEGRVVQSTRTTDEGNYRFKNVDAGKYKVRVVKKGYQSSEQSVSAHKAGDTKADFNLGH